MGRKRGKPSTQHKVAARLLAKGVSLKIALTQAGYSPAQARKGLAKIIRSPNFRSAVLKEFRRVPLGLEAVIVQGRMRRKIGLPPAQHCGVLKLTQDSHIQESISDRRHGFNLLSETRG